MMKSAKSKKQELASLFQKYDANDDQIIIPKKSLKPLVNRLQDEMVENMALEKSYKSKFK